jgi:hypothetical protein
MNTTSHASSIEQPKLISTFKAGFDTVANRISLIFLPLTLDLFLWLGPHFSIKQVLLSTIQQMKDVPGLDASQLNQLTTAIQNFGDTFNLAVALRTFPIGVSSLMWGQIPQQTPLGSAPIIQLPSYANTFFCWVLFLVVGITAGSFYFSQLSQVVFNNKMSGKLRQLPWAVLQVLVLSLAFLTLAILLSMPVMVMWSVLSIISPNVAQIILPFIAVIILWVLVPLVFSAHGIFAFHQNALVSMLTSTRLVRASLPGSGLFLLAGLVLSLGLDLLWSAPPDTSWLALVGIAGHAFVTTSVVAASFVYYRDIMRWVQETLQQQSASQNTSRV